MLWSGIILLVSAKWLWGGFVGPWGVLFASFVHDVWRDLFGSGLVVSRRGGAEAQKGFVAPILVMGAGPAGGVGHVVAPWLNLVTLQSGDDIGWRVLIKYT